jgi:hypothetical protein
MIDGSVLIYGSILILGPQSAAHQAYDMIRLNRMRRQIQRMLNDKVGSLKSLPPQVRARIADLFRKVHRRAGNRSTIIGCSSKWRPNIPSPSKRSARSIRRFGSDCCGNGPQGLLSQPTRRMIRQKHAGWSETNASPRQTHRQDRGHGLPVNRTPQAPQQPPTLNRHPRKLLAVPRIPPSLSDRVP